MGQLPEREALLCPGVPVDSSRSDDHGLAAGASSARFSARTLTRGSPRKPSSGLSAWASISARTRSTGRPRRRAMRARLVARRGEADLGIEAARRRRHQVDRHRRGVAGVGGAQRLDAPLDRIEQRRIRRPLVRAARAAAVVGHRRGRRGTAPEMLRIAEVLADQPRADGLAVALDQAAARLVRERRLRHAGDDERIGDSGDQRQQHEQHEGGTKGGVHTISLQRQARWAAASTRSISLMPTKGTIRPPTP